MQGPAGEIVCTIRERVAERVGANRYRTWFGGSTQFDLNGDRLDVTVANAFIGNWISSNFMPHLVEATRDVIGTDPRVEIHVNECKDSEDGNGQDQTPATAHAKPTAAQAQSTKGHRVARSALRGELEAFVTGPSNELAHSVASAVVRNPGGAFKHVVMHGGCGLGKTHLLQGICNGVSKRHPELEWCYLSGEDFTNEFIYAVKGGRVDGFRARFRNVDLLVIDDIHFLANKRATQDEFLHTFNAIDASGKTVVLSSDCHPRSIATLSEPLVNRLIAAMVVSIGPPDLATRREILRRRAAAMLIDLPEDVLEYVARHVTRNVRELEGALYKLAAYASLTRAEIGLEMTRRAIEDYVAGTQAPEAQDIERLVAAHFGVTRDALHSSSRDRTVTHARGFAMYLIRRHSRMSFPEIGRLMGNKQHSTVLMATKRIQELIDHDGAVTWKTPAGIREQSARSLLEEFEQRLLRGQDAP